MRLAELRIFLFDRGEAIFPSRPQFNCAAVSSGGRRRSSPQGTSCSPSHVPYSVWEAEAGRPSKTVLSASSESVILLTGHQDLASATHDREGWQGMSALLGYRGLDRKRAQF